MNNFNKSIYSNHAGFTENLGTEEIVNHNEAEFIIDEIIARIRA